MASGKALLEDITNQFLICKICFEDYKSPKTLNCLHTFCSHCLEKHADAEYERSYRYQVYGRSITCPICRKRTELPSGGIRRLQDNFLVTNLTDVINRVKPSSVPQCEICKNFKKTAAAACSKCLDCSKLLCKDCVESHKKTKVTQGHSLFDIQGEKDIECKVHPEEFVRFYCEPCQTCICVLCTFQDHKDHELSSFADGINKNCKTLENIAVSCEDRINKVKSHLDLINNCEFSIKEAEDQIRDVSMSLVQAIRSNQKNMVENLRNIYGSSTLEYIQSKDILKDNLENLQSTYDLTNLMLKEKSVELLLLKKDLEDKARGLFEAEFVEPPDGLGKHVKFVPGSLVLGFLDTSNTPKSEKDVDEADADDKKSEDKAETFKIQNYTEFQSQTETIEMLEKDTTMCKMCIDYSNDTDTQTDLIKKVHKETETPILMNKTKGTSTETPPSKDKGIATEEKILIRAKTQTETIEKVDRDVSTVHVSTFDKLTGTPYIRTVDRGTIPHLTENYRDKKTSTPSEWLQNKPDIKLPPLPPITLTNKGRTMVAKETTTVPISMMEMSTSTFGVDTMEVSTSMEGDMLDKTIKPSMVEASTFTNVPTVSTMTNTTGIKTKSTGTTITVTMTDTGVNPDPKLSSLEIPVNTKPPPVTLVDTGTMPDLSLIDTDQSHRVPSVNTIESDHMINSCTTVNNQGIPDGFKPIVPMANASTLTDSGLSYANLVLTGNKKKLSRAVTVDQGVNTEKIPEIIKTRTRDNGTLTDKVKYKTTASHAFPVPTKDKTSNTPKTPTESRAINTTFVKSLAKETSMVQPVMKDELNETVKGMTKDSSTCTGKLNVKDSSTSMPPVLKKTKDRGTEPTKVYLVDRRIGTEPIKKKKVPTAALR